MNKLYEPTVRNVLLIGCKYGKDRHFRVECGRALQALYKGSGNAGTDRYDYNSNRSKEDVEMDEILHKKSPLAGRVMRDWEKPIYYSRWGNSERIELGLSKTILVTFNNRYVYDHNKVINKDWSGTTTYETIGGYLMPQIKLLNGTSRWGHETVFSMGWPELKKYLYMPRWEYHDVKEKNWEMGERYTTLANRRNGGYMWTQRHNYRKIVQVTVARLIEPKTNKQDVLLLDPDTDTVLKFDLD